MAKTKRKTSKKPKPSGIRAELDAAHRPPQSRVWDKWSPALKADLDEIIGLMQDGEKYHMRTTARILIKRHPNERICVSGESLRNYCSSEFNFDWPT